MTEKDTTTEHMPAFGLTLIQETRGFRLGTDAVILSDFLRPPKRGRALELGCGSGGLAMLAAARHPGLRLDAIEINARAAGLARENAERNGLAERVCVYCRDLRETDPVLRARYALVFANPPYFELKSGKESAGAALGMARQDGSCTLDDICAAAGTYLRFGGRFAVSVNAARLDDMLCAMRAVGLMPKRLRLAAHTPDKAPFSAFIEAKKGARPGLTILPGLYLRGADGTESDEYRRIYRR